MSVSPLVPEKIKILDFKIIKGEIESPFDFDVSEVKEHAYSVKFETSFNIDKKLVKADFTVNVETVSDNDNSLKANGKFHFVFLYYIENIKDLINTDEEDESAEITIDGALGNALASFTYSTSRGVLMTRFQGTSLQSFILPVANPNDLLE